MIIDKSGPLRSREGSLKQFISWRYFRLEITTDNPLHWSLTKYEQFIALNATTLA